MEKGADGLADEVLRGVAPLPDQGRDIVDVQGDVAAQQHVTDVVGQHTVTGFAIDQGGLGRLAGADVAQGRDEADLLAGVVEHGREGAFHPDPALVRRPHPARRGLERNALPGVRTPGRQGGQVVRMDEPHDTFRDQLFGLVAEALDRRRDVKGPKIQIVLDDDVAGVVGQ